MYSIGETATGHNLPTRFARCNGMECVITGPLMWRRAQDPFTRQWFSVECYAVRWEDGHESGVKPENLAKRDPKLSVLAEIVWGALLDRLTTRSLP